MHFYSTRYTKSDQRVEAPEASRRELFEPSGQLGAGDGRERLGEWRCAPPVIHRLSKSVSERQ